VEDVEQVKSKIYPIAKCVPLAALLPDLSGHCMRCNLFLHVYSQLVQKGQLGHGDFVNRNSPKIVEELKGKHIVGGQSIVLWKIDVLWCDLGGGVGV